MQDRPSRERNSKRKPTSHTPTQWVLGEGTLGGLGLYSPARGGSGASPPWVSSHRSSCEAAAAIADQRASSLPGLSQEVVENDLQIDPENHLHPAPPQHPYYHTLPPHSDE